MENRYAFLSGEDGSSALHYNRDFISKLFFYDCYSEIKNMADAKKAKYYRQWLEEYDLLSELNYEERGYPESVSEKVKHVIADDITEALNDKFKGLKDEALNYALSEFDKRKHGLEATAKIWKCLALIFFIMTIVSIIALFI